MIDPTGITPSIVLRDAAPDDADFLFRLFVSVHAAELSILSWSPERKDVWLRTQFVEREQGHMQRFPAARSQVVLVDRVRAGRLLLFRDAQELQVLELSLLPGFRGIGFGSQLMRGVMNEAALSARRVSVTVAAFDRARRFCDRLGFRADGRPDGLHQRMVWELPER